MSVSQHDTASLNDGLSQLLQVLARHVGPELGNQQAGFLAISPAFSGRYLHLQLL
jgi:hypothetical protein